MRLGYVVNDAKRTILWAHLCALYFPICRITLFLNSLHLCMFRCTQGGGRRMGGKTKVKKGTHDLTIKCCGAVLNLAMSLSSILSDNLSHRFPQPFHNPPHRTWWFHLSRRIGIEMGAEVVVVGVCPLQEGEVRGGKGG